MKKAQLNLVPALIVLSIILGAIYVLPNQVLSRFFETRLLESKIWAERIESSAWNHDPVTGRVYPGVVAAHNLSNDVFDAAFQKLDSPLDIGARIDIEGFGTYWYQYDRYNELKPIAGISRYETYSLHQNAVFENGTRTRTHIELIAESKVLPR